MKSKLIIAGGSALILGAALITYLMKRTKTKQAHEPQQFKRTHHLTNVFAQAKNHAN